LKNFNLGGLHEKVFDLSSYLKDGEGFAGLLQSYNNFAGNLGQLISFVLVMSFYKKKSVAGQMPGGWI
jgi:hypothetical protein